MNELLICLVKVEVVIFLFPHLKSVLKNPILEQAERAEDHSMIQYESELMAMESQFNQEERNRKLFYDSLLRNEIIVSIEYSMLID